MTASTATLPADAASANRSKVGAAVDQLLAPPSRVIDELDIRLLEPSPDNPPGRISDDVDDLADSIRSIGILEPLIVATAKAWQSADDRLPWLEEPQFVVLAGHRRLGAARKVAGGGSNAYLVPCIVRDDLVGADADAVMVVENLQRKDPTAIDEARAYQRLQDTHGKSQRDIAAMVGKNQSHISKRLELLKLPEDLHAKVGTAELPIEDAITIAKVADDPKAVKAIMKRPAWQSIKDAADKAARDRREADAVAAAKKKLKDQGIRVVKYDTMHATSTPRPLSYLEERGLDVADHIHCECHAIAVGYKQWDRGQLQQVPVCTNPKVHPESKEAAQSSSQAAAERKAAREKKLREQRHAGRLAAIKSGVVKVDAATEQVASLIQLHDLLRECMDLDDMRVLADVLGVQLPVVDEDPEEAGRMWRDCDAEREAILTFAAGSATALKRALTATVLLRAEAEAEHSVWRDGPGRVAFLEWLPAHGHKLAAQERDVLKKAKGDD